MNRSVAHLFALFALATMACAKGQTASPPTNDASTDAHTPTGDASTEAASEAASDDGDSTGDAAADALDAADAVDAVTAPSDASDAMDGASDVVAEADASSATGVVLLACKSGSSGGSLLQAAFTSGWTPLVAVGTTTCQSSPALAPISGGVIGVTRASDNSLQWGEWSGSAFGAFTGLFGSNPAQGSPALAGSAGGAELVALVNDGASTNVLRAASFSGTWPASLEVVTNATSPIGASVASTPSGALLAFRGTDNGVYASAHSGVGWALPVSIGGGPSLTSTSLTPVVIDTGIAAPDAELFYADNLGDIYVQVRGSSGWTFLSAVASKGNANTHYPFSVVRGATGAIYVLFVGNDGNAYSYTQATPGGTFGTVDKIDSSGTAKALAASVGFGAYDVEVVTARSSGVIHHVRRLSGSWISGSDITGTVDSVAIATRN